MPMDKNLALLVQDTDVHGPGMQINATGKVMLFGVTSYEILWRRTGHTHGALVKLLEACFTQQERVYDPSTPEPHDR